jgi:peptide/nickel transport system ATP-binding protein
MVSPGLATTNDRATDVPLLEIEDLQVHYRTVQGIARAVDGVQLSLQRGEILGIAGESGCGKSTLASALLRLIRPPGFVAGGKVVLHPSDGPPIDLLAVDGAALRQIRWRHLSYIPQGSMNSLNPVLRVAAQFVDVMVQHGSASPKAAEAAVPELLRQVGLDGSVAKMFPHELSGGMKQRVIIAMATALRPDLMIADEPTTALDVNVQRMVIQTLFDLRAQLGVSLIIVTHDMAVHAELVDRVAVMYAGNIVEVGEVRQIFQQPRHPYSQGLIASIPRVGGERARLGGIAGAAPSPRNWPTGCKFHPRCPHVMEVCRQVVPPLRPITDTVNGASSRRSLVACHLYDSVARQGGR